jgi:hypothetical protein
MKIKITFAEPLLGTVPLNAELYADYIATKVPADVDTDDEMESVEELTTKGTTGFHIVDGGPILYDYAIKGFFKDAAGMLRRVPKTQSSKVSAYKKIIDGLIFVKPRQIPIMVAGEIGILERPLRAQTAQGERVSLARSQVIPAGSTMTFTVQLFEGVAENLVREWLDYGALRGLGQWRNGGYGSFTYEVLA